MPGEGIADQELGLFPFLDLRGAEISSSHCGPVYLIKLAKLQPKLRVVRSRVGQTEGPPTSMVARPRDDGMQVCLEVHDRRLASPVSELRMIGRWMT